MKNLLILIAVLGVLITGYLSFSYFIESVPFCSAEQLTGCATVVKSHHNKVGFVPVAVAGFVVWNAILIALLFSNTLIAFGLSSVGVIAGGYFNGVMFWKLNAFCPWCESSHFLMLVIFLILAQGFFAVKKITKCVGTAVVLFVVPFWLAGSDFASLDNSQLADCLSEKNVVMYGAYWCPHCKEQKELFGRSFERIKYVECADDINPKQQTVACVSAGIKNYPTWVRKDGELVTGTQSLEFLKSWADC